MKIVILFKNLIIGFSLLVFIFTFEGGFEGDAEVAEGTLSEADFVPKIRKRYFKGYIYMVLAIYQLNELAKVKVKMDASKNESGREKAPVPPGTLPWGPWLSSTLVFFLYMFVNCFVYLRLGFYLDVCLRVGLSFAPRQVAWLDSHGRW